MRNDCLTARLGELGLYEMRQQLREPLASTAESPIAPGSWLFRSTPSSCRRTLLASNHRSAAEVRTPSSAANVSDVPQYLNAHSSASQSGPR